ncbi:NTPase [Pseudomonas fluorescens]|uniref:NTPase n=1 Tax=Pseudomonas fluorescens TaxID=294 RepID=A0A854X018_PSEFL|nr:NACHT domain-containing protein [Pseudomonas fluorescens]PCM48706.1 NTPase [Pseudomonas fluorescens]
MATKDSTQSTLEKSLEFAERTFNLLWKAENPQDIWHWVILVFVTVAISGIILIIALKAFGSVIEHLATFIEAYKSSGLPMWLNTTNKSRVRRRKQFCSVLDADLAYLAKAENWNDQHFTDLEAEVETEGGYYATAWDRLRRKKSFGLRKERSLIRAITSSTERAMQLVGEPGSGKSVALRHLAKQFSEQGRKSNDKNATVPLYINLREMESSHITAVNANSVREFVLDNIRRGDADTSAYVRENWEDYCNRGIWLFLFDSFDEIPAVLHSEAGSNVVRHYSQAIRQFLEGMGECKGILASREFKGPEALPWKKLRILPLSGEKQDELIQNSFLDTQHMSLVRQHLARSHSSIGATPLFLTLLCRYVRDEHHAPNNDHDILLQHIERLARREPEYLLRKYKLIPDQLITGAEHLARLFAEDDTLSLAPSLDQIIARLPANQIPEELIERIIAALVDCKIGRADVPNAAQGDRRFAFAHRRYQEALFVRYLARNPEAISAKDLLTEPRWREYTVTLLQTRNPAELTNLLNHARQILEDCTAQQSPLTFTLPPLPADLGYFDWTSEIAVPLLSLLQEGLARRLEDTPSELSSAINDFLAPRWLKGDTWDRCEVLRLGGLLPQNTLVKYLVETFNHGTESERLHAFRQATFTSELPEAARTAVLQMLSDQVILAKNRADQLTIEALAARLPANMGASFVVSRGNQLRQNLGLFKKVGSSIKLIIPFTPIRELLRKLLKSESTDSNLSTNRETTPICFDLLRPVFMLLAVWFVCTIELSKDPSGMTITIFSAMSLLMLTYCVMFCPFLVRHLGRKIGLNDVKNWISDHLISKNFLEIIFTTMLFGAALLLASAAIGYIVDWLFRTYLSTKIFDVETPTLGSRIGVGMASIMFSSYALMIPSMLISSRKNKLRERKYRNELEDIKKTKHSDIAILYSAKNLSQLIFWLKNNNNLLSETGSIRSFSSFILKFMRVDGTLLGKPIMELPGCLKSRHINKVKDHEDSAAELGRVRQILEDRFIRTLKQ